MPSDYDAILLVSFGGPEEPDDVLPFLHNVTRGRDVPLERLEEVRHHYLAFGGRSPINDQNRELLRELRELLERDGPALPVYWGNRNWHPMLADTVRQMRDDGVRRALCFVTAAYASYSGCRQYLEDLERARAEVGDDAPVLDKLRTFHNHPGFVEPQVDALSAALASLPADRRERVHVLFTTHSIPLTMAAGCDYETQHRDTCQLIVRRLPEDAAQPSWDLVFSSRSGPAHVPWLEPDVNDRIEQLADEGVTAVVVAPIGFVSDHLEVLYDLDVEAAETAQDRGLGFARVATVGTDPRFVAMVRELVLERTAGAPARALGELGPSHDVCPAGCCLAGSGPRPQRAPSLQPA